MPLKGLKSHFDPRNLWKFFFNFIFGHQGVRGTTCKWFHFVTHPTMVISTPWTSKYVNRKVVEEYFYIEGCNVRVSWSTHNHCHTFNFAPLDLIFFGIVLLDLTFEICKKGMLTSFASRELKIKSWSKNFMKKLF